VVSHSAITFEITKPFPASKHSLKRPRPKPTPIDLEMGNIDIKILKPGECGIDLFDGLKLILPDKPPYDDLLK